MSLLEELFVQRGLSWSDIARLVGVSVQAVRKWRQLHPITGENRLAVARIAVVLDLLEAVPVQDPVGWLEIPVLPGYSLRHIDLYRDERVDLLFDLAHLRITPQQALFEVRPDWQEALRLDNEVFDADDGHRIDPSLRMRGDWPSLNHRHPRTSCTGTVGMRSLGRAVFQGDVFRDVEIRGSTRSQG